MGEAVHEWIEAEIHQLAGPFTLSNMRRIGIVFPTTSPFDTPGEMEALLNAKSNTLKVKFRELLAHNLIQMKGRGRGTYYTRSEASGPAASGGGGENQRGAAPGS